MTRSFFLPQPDAYDMVVRELGFEMKAQPSNRMKTEAELAKEEEERLKKLEVGRAAALAAPALAGGKGAVLTFV